MNSKKLLLLILAGSSIAFGQFKMPNLQNVKDKINAKIPVAAAPSATPAATAPAANTANSSPAPANSATTAPQAPVALPPPGPVQGKLREQGVELTLCETPAKDPASPRWDVICAKPTRTFPFHSGVNVVGVMRFTPALTSRSEAFKVVMYQDDKFYEYREIAFQTGGRTAIFTFSMAPGNYTVKLQDQYGTNDVSLTDRFMVSPDAIGDRATGDIKSGSAKLMICSTVDDNGKCVNESTTWAANQPFNMYVKLAAPSPGQLFVGYMIHKQNPDGTDGAYVDEILQGQLAAKTGKWATTNGNRLPAGTYTIYAIDWQTKVTTGNYKQYFAKTTLVVK